MMRKTQIAYVGLVTAGTCLVFGEAQAAITADFTDHVTVNTTYFTGATAGDTSAVDQYSGTAGDGWTSAWAVESSGSNEREKRVLTDNMIVGGGNYLQVEHKENDSTNTRNFYVSRQLGSFGSVDVTQSNVIEFYYRPDVISAFAGGGATFVDIRGGGNRSSLTGNRWSIRSTGGTTKRFTVADGAGDAVFGNIDFVDTGIQINAGDVYKFTITVDPTSDTWDITLDNISDVAAAYNGIGLGFVENGSDIGTSLLFGSQILGVNQTTTPLLDSEYTFSIDAISIDVPEPASLALMGLGGLLMLSRRRDAV